MRKPKTKKRAPWGSKTRNGKPTTNGTGEHAPTLVPTIETVPLKEVWDKYHLSRIHDMMEMGAVVSVAVFKPVK